MYFLELRRTVYHIVRIVGLARGITHHRPLVRFVVLLVMVLLLLLVLLLLVSVVDLLLVLLVLVVLLLLLVMQLLLLLLVVDLLGLCAECFFGEQTLTIL